MLDATVSLVSADASVIEAVEGVIDSVGNLRLVVLPGTEEASSHLEGSEVALIVGHMTQGSNVSAVTSLLRTIAANRRPVPLLILSDEYHAEQALALLRLGAVDYLSRPLDLRRLTYLLDVLTVRARIAGSGAKVVAETPAHPDGIQSLGQQEAFLYYPYADMGRLMNQVRTIAPQ